MARSLDPPLPVSGLSLVMSHGYDAQYVGIIYDGKWKTVKNEGWRSVQVLGPALRGLGNAFKCIRDSGDQSDTGVQTALPVPVVPGLDFLPR